MNDAIFGVRSLFLNSFSTFHCILIFIQVIYVCTVTAPTPLMRNSDLRHLARKKTEQNKALSSAFFVSLKYIGHKKFGHKKTLLVRIKNETNLGYKKN